MIYRILNLVLSLLLVQFMIVLTATANTPTPAFPDNQKMLKFKAGAHVMGFLPGKVYFAQTDHALSIEFIRAKPISPQANTCDENKDDAVIAPLHRVDYPNLWDGITARYKADDKGIAESVYIIKPGAEVQQIQLKYNSHVTLHGDGTLSHHLPTKRGWITESKPIAWQQIKGKRVDVSVAFTVNGGQVGFTVGNYDKHHTLTIDPVYEWHTYYGSKDVYDNAIDMAADGSGNVYILGTSDLDWDGDDGALALHGHNSGKTIASGADTDIVVIKLNSAGAYVWHTFYGAVGGDSPTAIDVTSNGDVYVTGYSPTWQGDNNASPLRAHSGVSGEINTFILKLNNTGVYQWHTFYGPVSSSYVFTDISADTNDTVYITGTSETNWLGDNNKVPLHEGAGFAHVFVLKLDSTGSYKWHTFYSGLLGVTRGDGITVGSSGELYITGYSNLSWMGDNDTVSLRGYEKSKNNVFVLKLNNFGVYQWHTFYGLESSTTVPQRYNVAVDSANSVYVTGASSLEWQGDSGESPLRAHSGVTSTFGDIFILKLDTAGAYQWHTFYGDYNGGGDGIAIDGADNVYITGTTTTGNWLGAGDAQPLKTVAFGSVIFALELTRDGAYQWHTFYEPAPVSPYNTYGTIDSAGNAFILGVSNGTWQADEGVTPLNANSGGLYPDISVLKLAVGSEPDDTIPNTFSFIDQNNVAQTTVITSNTISITGINAPAAISVSGGEYRVNNGPWLNTPSTVTNGQNVSVRLTSSADLNSTTGVILSVGGISDTFSVTTAGSSSGGGTNTATGSSSSGGSLSLLELIAGIFAVLLVGARRKNTI